MESSRTDLGIWTSILTESGNFRRILNRQVAFFGLYFKKIPLVAVSIMCG